jgi:Sulfatase
MDRRTFLKQTATTGGALVATGLLGNPSKVLQSGEAAAQGGQPPNILFILVDELRFPRVFPQGINDAGEFLHAFMPNTYQSLWVPGVKFAGHYTAGVACTPARGTLITGPLHPAKLAAGDHSRFAHDHGVGTAGAQPGLPSRSRIGGRMNCSMRMVSKG